jgi:membrane associated rhomboid family serine protease
MLILILLLTGAISWWAFQDPSRKDQLMLKPYVVKKNREWHRVLTHGFIHADTTHLFFNLFVLWQFGGAVEKTLNSGYAEPAVASSGNYTFLMLYFGGLLFASLPAMFKHANNPGYGSLGASGAVSAVMMAYILCFPTAKLLLFFVIPMPAFVAGALFFAYESYMNKQGGSRIAHDAHLYGALYGVLFTFAADSGTFGRLVGAITSIF